MKKTLLLLILFVALAGGTMWYMQGKDTKDSIALSDRDFAVKDLSSIHKIFLADRSGRTVTLERKSDREWIYNGEYMARPNVMVNLLTTIRGVQMQSIPPKAAEKNIINDLAVNGIKVELYDKGNNKMKAYYVGGVTNNEKGTYMIMEGANQPYIMERAGFEGSLRINYWKGEEDWRDKALFRENPDNISAVSIEYPKQKNQSFVLERKDDSFQVKPFYGITPKSSKAYKEGSGEAFLLGFEKLFAESFENQYAAKDSILNLVPFAKIKLTRNDNTAKELTLFTKYRIDAEGRIISQENINERAMAIDRYFVNLDNKDFMMAQHQVIQKILWGYDFFLEK